MVVVSHDQAFLNAIATDIIHLVANRLDAYRGDYDTFVKAREERLLNEEREYLAQKAERDHIQVGSLRCEFWQLCAFFPQVWVALFLMLNRRINAFFDEIFY